MNARELEPVRLAILRQAHRDAGAAVSAATQESDGVLGHAYRQADELLAAARVAGRRDAEVLAAVRRARTRRSAREADLRTGRAAYDEVRRRATEALRQEAADPKFRCALVARATDALGADVDLRFLPDGGLLGTRDGHLVDCSLESLVDHALDVLADQLAQVWS